MTTPNSNSQESGKVWEPGPFDLIRNCLDNSLKRAAELLRSTGNEGDAIDANRLDYQRELNAIAAPSQEGRSSLSVEGSDMDYGNNMNITLRAPLTNCAADRNGDCDHPECPQLRDGEPKATGRSCPRIQPEQA